VTGALRTYLQERGIDVDDITVRAMVPVDLRPPERALDLGNEFGLVILDLAVGARTAGATPPDEGPHGRTQGSPEAMAIMALFTVFGRVPKAIEDLAVDLFSSKASVVLTNVAGSSQQLYVAGTPVERFMFWVPHPGKQLGWASAS